MDLILPRKDTKGKDDEPIQAKHLRELTKTFCGIEKPLKNCRPVHGLQDLRTELHREFDGDHVNIEYVNHLLLSYESNIDEWRKYAKFDRYRYTRNLVDAGNGKFNLMILCWNLGHASPIHDHSDSHCFMKVLAGELCEVRYAWPEESIKADESDLNAEEEELDAGRLTELSRTTMELNSVFYINDNLGLHRVENSSHTNVAVSLHLYCPPFDTCSMYNEKTGKETKCTVTFWSKDGKKQPQL